jgi:nitrite reductase (NADH) small subunit/3-phenylpropionate/trans-cinnamate dioxygenase ferredoxin subunit
VADRIVVAREGEIAPGGCRVVTVNQREVAVFHVDGQYFAIDDRCPHAGASLSGGHVENGIVTCPWHYWRFRLCDGAWADNPRIRTRSYPIVVEQGEICLVTDSPQPN